MTTSTVRTLWSENLVKKYGDRTVVREISLRLSQGEVVGLLGPNGAGKTTTFYMITGMVRPDGGRIFLDSDELTQLPMYRRARHGLGYLPQEASIFRKLTVEQNIMAILQTRKMSRKERRDRLQFLLDDFKIAHLRKNPAVACSGGERRRLEIARALASEPDFLLLDEPFAGIDPIAVEDIQSIIAKLRNQGMGILITDHNVRETLAITDRAYIVFQGEILIEGTARDLADDPEARRIYLGEKFTLKET